jgi:hypothetical protein
MPLTDTAIKNAKPADKPIRMFDGGGLYLEVSPVGGKLWRLKYRLGGMVSFPRDFVFHEMGYKSPTTRKEKLS